MSEDNQLPIESLLGSDNEPPGDDSLAVRGTRGTPVPIRVETSTEPTPDQESIDSSQPVNKLGDPLAPQTENVALPLEDVGPPALYFLTNRMNLNGVLSSRLVGPREAFYKYYADLLEKTPGWVPLLTRPPTPELIDAVTVERGSGAPVVIEFPAAIAPETTSQTDPVVYVPAVALADATAIHFREERDIREHRARGYNNVHPHDTLLRVTPELFAGEGTDNMQVNSAGEAPKVDWRRVDRIRGAINAAVVAAHSGEQLAVAAAFLGGTKLPAALTLPEWINWREIDDHLPLDDRAAPESTAPDHAGFRAGYDVLGEQDVTEAWSPNMVLDAVEAQVLDGRLNDEAADAIMRNLQRVRAIVNVEVDFEPFRPTGRALISAKALLLVLLRQDLDQLLAWPERETGADETTTVVTAVLAGRLRGLSREVVDMRRLALDDLTAAWAIRVANGRGGGLGRVQFAASGKGTSLRLDGIEVGAQDALLPDLVAKYNKLVDAKKQETRIRVSRAMGWPVEHRIELPPGAVVTQGDAVVSIAAPSPITVTQVVDEDAFVRQLAALPGSARREAAKAFSARR